MTKPIKVCNCNGSND